MPDWHPGGMAPVEDQELGGAIVAAGSSSWSVRAEAGRRLAAAAQLEAISGVLQLLLLDAHDTAVTSETAVALLERGDLAGLRAVLVALSRATDIGTADQLIAELDGDPRWMTGDGVDELIRQLRTLTSDVDQGVSDEARLRLSRLR